MTLVRRLDASIVADPARTVLRPFELRYPDAFAMSDRSRYAVVAQKVAALPEAQLRAQIAKTMGSLRARHQGADETCLARFEELRPELGEDFDVDQARRLLIGAYFIQEFAFESVALFNPSVVRHPDQSSLEPGATRLVLSLRGIGEGHLSSVTFRTAVWHANGTLAIDAPSRHAIGPTVTRERLANGRMRAVLECGNARDISESVIYPFLPSQGRGVEDVRLVEFTDDDGATTYRGTFTAFDGTDVRQGLLQTSDFRSFEARGVEGDLYAGKGMALFPRKIGGRYAMLSRQDNESIWLVFSNDLYEWSGGARLLGPSQPWEYVQMGNCGSPLEIDEGFLILTHGVGGARTYSMGAALLDKDDPSRVLARLAEPLLEPGDDRDGYVPNVVYSCGALLRDRELLLPYAVADSATRFGRVGVDELIGAMSWSS